MTKYRVADLEGALLDAAVAKADGKEWRLEMVNGEPLCCTQSGSGGQRMWCGSEPSVAWSQGGPIIDREGICLMRIGPGLWSANFDLDWYGLGISHHHTGATPLIASMRAYVASKFGDEVDL